MSRVFPSRICILLRPLRLGLLDELGERLNRIGLQKKSKRTNRLEAGPDRLLRTLYPTDKLLVAAARTRRELIELETGFRMPEHLLEPLPASTESADTRAAASNTTPSPQASAPVFLRFALFPLLLALIFKQGRGPPGPLHGFAGYPRQAEVEAMDERVPAPGPIVNPDLPWENNSQGGIKLHRVRLPERGGTASSPKHGVRGEINRPRPGKGSLMRPRKTQSVGETNDSPTFDR